MKFKTRKPWRNVDGNQRAQPLRQYSPRSLEELQQIVRDALRDRVQVRAIGSSHSWSDVCVTTGYMVRPEELNRVLPLEKDLLRGDVDAAGLFRIESGVRLRVLNDVLWKHGLGLANMGGYDAQTLVGATATSTHGSGLSFGPLSDFLVSIDLVAGDGAVYRIERSDGITDRAAYERAYPDRRLVQDDAWFNAVAVSMGCMGLIYSVVFRVVPRYFLKEVRTRSTWTEVKEMLRKGDVFRENRHFEVLINPYKIKGENGCLITTRNPTPNPRGLAWDKLRRRLVTELLASLPHMDRVLSLIFDRHHRLSRRLIDAAMGGLVDDGFSGRSYKVLNIGMANEVPALSAEIAYPLRDELYIQGVERVLALAEEHARLGQIFHSSPMSLRFVKGTDLFLSPQHGGDTAMLEIIMVRGTHGVFEMLYEYEIDAYKVHGRPHWGQINSLTGSHDLVRSMYPRYGDWMAVYAQMNATGVFDSPFATRVGFSRHPFSSAAPSTPAPVALPIPELPTPEALAAGD